MLTLRKEEDLKLKNLIRYLKELEKARANQAQRQRKEGNSKHRSESPRWAEGVACTRQQGLQMFLK